MDKVTVNCPHCGKEYVIPASGLGKQGRCKKCNTIFTTSVDINLLAEAEQSAEAVPIPASPSASASTPQEKGGFLKKMNEWADKASRQVAVTYIQGPWSIKAKSPVTLVLDDDALLLRSGIIKKEEFAIPYESITEVAVDTAERMTLTRVLLVGVFAFGMKKKDKFLKLNFTDETGTNASAIFGKGAGSNMQDVYGRILDKQRERLLKIQGTPTPRVVEEGTATGPSTDIASDIENIARLRDQGLLSEEEFQAKKKELLARL